MASRTYKVVRKVEETPNTTSVYLSPSDGDVPLQPFRAGQHLVFQIPGVGERAYVLSAFSARPKTYRITVRRAIANDDATGHGSLFWHAKAANGDLVRASGPTGSFHLPEKLEHPLVFLSAGVGEAPLAAIAEELAIRAPRHKVCFLHSTINGSTFALKGKLGSLRADLANATWRVWYDHPRLIDRKDKDYDHAGEIGIADLKRLLPFDDSEFYVCGPDAFVARAINDLQELDITIDRIRAEPLGTENDTSIEIDETDTYTPQLEPRRINFIRSGLSAIWKPEVGSLLEFAESLGLTAAFSCRTGMCGRCAQRIVSGDVANIRDIHARPKQGHQLLCSNVPLSDMEIDL